MMLSRCLRTVVLGGALFGTTLSSAEPTVQLLASFPADLEDGSATSGFASGSAIDGSGMTVPAAYFLLWSQSRQANVIWVTDGTVAGTHEAAAADVDNANGSVHAAPSVGAFFDGYTEDAGWQIFRTDGPAASARALTHGTPGFSMLGVVDGHPTAFGAGPSGYLSVLKVDGDSGALSTLATVPSALHEWVTTDHAGFVISPLASPDNADQITSFHADGSPSTILPALSPNTYWYYPHHIESGRKLACMESFTQYPSSTTQELYCSDGTIAGTHRPVPPALGTGVGLRDSTTYYAIGDRLLFEAPSSLPSPHVTPWVTDGTDNGTFPLLDENLERWAPCSDDSSGGIYFIGYDYIDGGGTAFRLWYTDGTREGTRRVAAIPESSCSRLGVSSAVTGLTYLQLGSTLYRTDGTSAGTHAVAGAPQLADFHYPSDHQQGIAALGRWLVFRAPASATQVGLWRLDLDSIFTDAFED